MIAALMLYSLATSILVGVAAVAAERVVRLARRPARVVWMAAMLAALGLSATRFVSGLAKPIPSSVLGATPTALTGVGDDQRPVATPFTPAIGESAVTPRSLVRAVLARLNAARILVTSGSTMTRLDQPLLIAWFTMSMIGLVVIGYSVFELARPRRRWPTTTVDGVPVLLSHDVGPAVVGLFRYRIVLPEWTLTLPLAQRDLVLMHEREHAAAADPLLLFAATALVALSPWNVALWWMALRLRFAIELDCDARVLRRRPDHRAYGALLLDVSERTFGGVMPVVAMAEPISLVERRIAAMMSDVPRFARLRAIVAGSCVVVLVAAACVAPRPASVSTHRAASSPAIRSNATRSDVGARTDEVRAEALRLASTRLPNVVAPIPSRRFVAPEHVSAARIETPVRLTRVSHGVEDVVDQAFHLIYDGIALTPEQVGQARGILTRLFEAALAQDAIVQAAALRTLPQRQALLAERDSTLRALLTNDADRATLDARLAALPDGGMRGRSGGPGPDGARGRVGGAGGGQRVGGDGRGRVGGDGSERRVSVTTTIIVPKTVQVGPGTPFPSIVETIFHRLFDGIALTPEQEASAQATLTETQQALQALTPSEERLPIMSDSELALVALVTNDADRKTVQGRISALDAAAPFQR
jgi:beta-lactamase regulating signal transducer with metallopeptidase domain